MVLAQPPPLVEQVDGIAVGFCSEYCRSTFREDPTRYLGGREVESRTVH
jgi:hypothetical protein